MNGRSAAMRVWDLPTRIVHWLLLGLIAFSWWTAENGQLQWHRYSGQVILALLLFRLYWAFAGADSARLWRFLRGPRALFDYAKTLGERTAENAPRAPGHNPLGAWSALAIMTLVLAQIALGVFAVDVDGIESGPLSHLVSFEAGRACAELHETLFNVLLAFIGLHIAAVFFYLLYKRENLIAPMISGVRKNAAAAIQTRPGSWIRALLGAVLAAAASWAVACGLWT